MAGVVVPAHFVGTVLEYVGASRTTGQQPKGTPVQPPVASNGSHGTHHFRGTRGVGDGWVRLQLCAVYNPVIA